MCTLHSCNICTMPETPSNLRKFAFTTLYGAVRNAWFADPYMFGHLLHQLRVFFLQLPIPYASCSCAPCISATSSPYRKIPPKFLKFPLTTLYGALGEGWVCWHVQVWVRFAPTAGFLFFNSPSSLLHVHVYLAFVQHLHHSEKYPRICGNLRLLHYTARCETLGLQTRTCLGTFCTNCVFFFFNFPSPMLLAHVHLALVQHHHHGGKSPRTFASFL